jgi:UDP-N-acetylglucosamine 2-epimerase
MVQGDTTSALACALVGSYHRHPVAHVEAGLRTYEREPFPEEMNRALIGRLARWHFAPTDQARRNLLSEGIDEDCIHQVGNPVIDATLWTREVISRAEFELAEFAPPGLCSFLTRHKGRPTILITAHRRENWGQPIANIATAIARILATHEDVVAVWPVHPNPAVIDDIERGLAGLAAAIRDRIELTEPLEYPAMITLLTRCVFTITDSGGIQEEASALRVPVLIARDSTERQELVDAGGAEIVGTEVETLMSRACALLDDAEARRGMKLAESPFGDGRSAQRIADVLSMEPLRRSTA